MDIALILVRTVHFAGALALAGLYGFVVTVAGPALPVLRRRLLRIGWISLAALLLSAVPWLLLVARDMSGTALQPSVIATVISDTQFGRVLALRVVLVLLAIPCVALLGRRRLADGAGALFAVVQLAAIAWQGHAGADVGWEALIHLTADAAHLVAAGLWLGALLPLALLLRAPVAARLKHRATVQFSRLGVICVGILLVSGTVNAWLLVGSWPALIGTSYGQVLVVKLALVAGMLVIAATNRWYLTPRLQLAGDSDIRIARHARIEAGLGLGVIAIVAALGTMVPGAHQQIRWPFAYRLTLAWWPPAAHLVPATPTSYAVSPEPFAVATIAAGQTLYRQQCVSCHGDEGQGDGPMVADLPIVPLDFASPAVAAKPEGDLYDAIANGMPGAMMPRFAALSGPQRWDLVTYLTAQQQAAAASSTLIAEATASPAPIAPDFALPTPQGDAGTLKDLLAQGDVLLVFDGAPPLAARLDQLGQWRDALRQAGVAVVTIADTPDIRSVYALYERRPQLETPPAPHVEFLIDRDGYIRARWHPGDTLDWTQLPVLEREIAAMQGQKLAPVAVTGHVHEGM